MLQQQGPQSDRGAHDLVAGESGGPPHQESPVCDERASLTLDSSLLAPSRARALVARGLCRRHAVMASAAAGLVASELVTDAVLGGHEAIAIVIECHVSTVRLSVTRSDDGRTRSSELRLADPVADMIVAGISRASGTQVSDHGVTLWCEVPTGFLPTQRSRASG